MMILLWTAILVSCSGSSEVAPELTGGACASDRGCPAGEECSGDGCIPAPASLYPHIQLASVSFHESIDQQEVQWRAAHNDLLIGMVASDVDVMRSHNPNIRLYESFNLRYHRYEEYANEWAADNGCDAEDFYLHYREDVTIQEAGSAPLVEGFPAGVVPGWNPARQEDDPPASAEARWQSRAIGRFGSEGEPWYLANISHSGYRQFLSHYAAGLIDGSIFNLSYSGGTIDGVLTDEALYYPMFNVGQIDKTLEFFAVPLDESHPYGAAFVTFHAKAKQYLSFRIEAGKDLIPNYTHVYWLNHSSTFPRDLQRELAWAWCEVWMIYRSYEVPTSGSNRVITYQQDYENGVLQIVRKTRAGMRIVLGARDAGGGVTGSERGRLMTLALYYLIQNPNTFYSYSIMGGAADPMPISDTQWNPAVEFDVGRPASIPDGFTDFEGKTNSMEFYEFAGGPDPYD
ncbi:MAG: hypothetical protein ABIA59_04610, partial [Candidatus Latescibacterota bacterium]